MPEKKKGRKKSNPDLEDVETEEIEDGYVSDLEEDKVYDETQEETPKEKKGWVKSLIVPFFKKSESSDMDLETEETKRIESEFISNFENSGIHETLEDTPPKKKSRRKSSTATSTRKSASKKTNQDIDTEDTGTEEMEDEYVSDLEDDKVYETQEDTPKAKKGWSKSLITPFFKKPKSSDMDSETEDIESEFISNFENSGIHKTLEDTPPERKGRGKTRTMTSTGKSTSKKSKQNLKTEFIPDSDDNETQETFEDEQVRETHVTKEDFSELKNIVKNIGMKIEELTDAQKSKDKEIPATADKEELSELKNIVKNIGMKIEELTDAQKSKDKEKSTLKKPEINLKTEDMETEVTSGPDADEVHGTLEDSRIIETQVTKDEFSELKNIVKDIGAKIGAFTISPGKSRGKYPATHLHRKSTSKKPKLYMENEFFSDTDDTDVYETLEDARIREDYVTNDEFSELMNIVRDIGIKVGVLVVAPRER